MNMSEIITIVISAVGGSAALFAVVAFLIRSLMNHILSKDIEKFKVNLESESKQELLRVQSSLQLSEFEHQIRFTQLHERLAEAAIEVYGRLRRVYMEVNERFNDFSGDQRDDKEIKEALKKIASELDGYYYPRRILFPQEISDHIDEFIMMLRKVLLKQRQLRRVSQDPENPKCERFQDEIDTMIEDNLPKLFKSLETHFRKILGVISPLQDMKPIKENN